MEISVNLREGQITKANNQNELQVFYNELQGNFNLREPKGIKPTLVYFVVRIDGKQVKVSTSLKVYPKYFNSKEGKALESTSLPLVENRNNKILNQRISLYQERFCFLKVLASEGKATINQQTIKNYLTQGIMSEEKAKNRINIGNVLRHYLTNDQSISDSTKSNYIRFIKTFSEYMSNVELYEYQQITQETIKGFQEWCVHNVKGRNGERAQSAHINKIVECVLKQFKKYLVGNGLMKNSHFQDIQVEPLKEVFIDDEIALLDDEINLLYNYQPKTKVDEEIRDLFLLECLIGQRFSDTKKVSDLIQRKNGRTYISYTQEKTGTKVEIDILFQLALDILNKYNDKLPTVDKSRYNKRIKVIAKEAGIRGTEIIRYEEAGKAGIKEKKVERYNRISSHTGRRTLCTLLALRGFSDNEIMRYSGHSSTQMVALYNKSKVGTKILTMYQQIKQYHPEQLLKMVGETSTSTPNLTIEGKIQEMKEVLAMLNVVPAYTYQDLTEYDKVEQIYLEVHGKLFRECETRDMLENLKKIFNSDMSLSLRAKAVKDYLKGNNKK